MTDVPALIRELKGHRGERRPAWLMRQAGRYLPEYKALRAEKGGFLDLVYDAEAAAEVTIQPLRRFDLDAAILFSDILIVPHAMGQDLQFLAGEGPHLSPRMVDATLDSLQAVPERLEAIYRTVTLVRAALAPDKALLGFAGSPWTVATYMVHGEGSRDQHEARAFAYRDPAAFGALIDAIVDVTITYLDGQIRAGAQGIQLFDSWAGSLSPRQFEQWVIAPTVRIVDAVRALHPDVAIIGFPKGAGGKLAAYARETRIDALGLDETVDPVWAHAVLPEGLPVQGNLDPLALIAGGDELIRAARHVLTSLEGRPHVFNLGHGINQFTPIAHVEALIALLRDHEA